MFRVQLLKTEKNMVGKWIDIWVTDDPTEAAEYLRSAVSVENRTDPAVVLVEYRVIFLMK